MQGERVIEGRPFNILTCQLGLIKTHAVVYGATNLGLGVGRTLKLVSKTVQNMSFFSTNR